MLVTSKNSDELIIAIYMSISYLSKWIEFTWLIFIIFLDITKIQHPISMEIFWNVCCSYNISPLPPKGVYKLKKNLLN